MSRPHTQILMCLASLVGLIGGGAIASPSLDACLAECKRSQMSVTNRATCRLDCEVDAASDPEQIRARIEPMRPTPSKPVAPPPGTTPTTPGPANGPGCKAACDAETSLSVDDRATCKLECDLEPAPMPTGTPPPMRPPKGTPGPSVPGPATTATTPGPMTTPGPSVPGAGLTWTSSRPVSASPASQAGFLAKCHASCKPGASAREATDFETCKLDCDMMASVLEVAAGFVPDAWLEVPRPIATRDPTPVPTPVPTPTPTPTPTHVSGPGKPAASTPGPAPEPDDDTCSAALERCKARCAKVEASCRKGCGRKHAIETDRETCKLGCGTEQEVCQGDCLTDHATCVNSLRGR